MEFGAYYLMVHAEIVKWTGTIALGSIVVAFLLKMINVLSFVLCPLKMLWFKKLIRSE
jgi:hypothetical protein